MGVLGLGTTRCASARYHYTDGAEGLTSTNNSTTIAGVLVIQLRLLVMMKLKGNSNSTYMC